MKTIYFDCETTGLNPIKNDIIQIAGIIEDEGKEIEKFNIKIQPTNWHNIDERALEVNKLTIEQLKTASSLLMNHIKEQKEFKN